MEPQITKKTCEEGEDVKAIYTHEMDSAELIIGFIIATRYNREGGELTGFLTDKWSSLKHSSISIECAAKFPATEYFSSISSYKECGYGKLEVGTLPVFVVHKILIGIY